MNISAKRQHSLSPIYEEERVHVSALPIIDNIPDLSGFADNGLGVSALDGGRMVSFMCAQGVWNNAWGISGLRNIFSSMHTNGAASHAVCLYAHDKESQNQFYHYGFGVRCVDAIREMDEIVTPICDGYDFSELTLENILEVLPLENNLDKSYIDIPFFMFKNPHNKGMFLKKI